MRHWLIEEEERIASHTPAPRAHQPIEQYAQGSQSRPVFILFSVAARASEMKSSFLLYIAYSLLAEDAMLT